MFNITNVKNDFAKIRFGDPFQEYSRVEMNLSDEEYVATGNKTGRTLVFDCPLVSDWLEKDLDPENGIENPASEKVVRNIKKQIRGFIYQPYNASGVMIEPAVELGDGIFINNIYSGIYSMDVKFSKTEAYISDISAPNEEEIDHEFPYEPKTERKINRRIRNAEATLKVQTDEISAKVSAVDGSRSFSWELTKDYWRIKAKGKTILKVSEDGFWFNGDGTFTGNVYAGNIKSGKSDGVNYGTFNGAGITAGSITRKKMDSDIDKLLDYAGTAGDLFRGATEVGNIWTGRLKVSGVVEMFGYKIGIKTTYVGTERIYYLAPVEDVA